MEKPLGGYFQVWYSYYQATQCNKKSSIPVSSRWQVRSGKAKKGQASILITATTRVYLPKPVSTNLIIKPYSVLTKPIGKGVVQSWSMENIYHIRHFYCDTITRIATNKTKEAPSPDEVRLVPLDTNPVFQCLVGRWIFDGSLMDLWFLLSLLINISSSIQFMKWHILYQINQMVQFIYYFFDVAALQGFE